MGVYSVSVTDTDGVSSSYSVKEEGQRMGLNVCFFIYLWRSSINMTPVFFYRAQENAGAELQHQTSQWVVVISWECKNDLVYTWITFLLFYQLFHWRRSWIMRFWRRVTCGSGCRLWSCPPLSTTGSSSTIKPSRVLRYKPSQLQNHLYDIWQCFPNTFKPFTFLI